MQAGKWEEKSQIFVGVTDFVLGVFFSLFLIPELRIVTTFTAGLSCLFGNVYGGVLRDMLLIVVVWTCDGGVFMCWCKLCVTDPNEWNESVFMESGC